jgi:internalin A
MSPKKGPKGVAEAVRRIEEAKRSGSESLDLSELELTAIPDSIARLVNLKTLNLVGNQITAIPDSIARLVNLEHLNLSENQITTIPDAIAQLVNLRYLNLRHNQIIAIPDSIVQLVHLEDLYLGQKQITAIPDSISQLVNLQHLNLENSQITFIPDSIAQLVNLRSLHLSGNQISFIPGSIDQFVNLRDLGVAGNNITFIPDSIAQLVNLQNLFLSVNQITAIPESIAQLINLQELDLASNQITAIPESIAQLINLQKLDLASNQITAIPESIAQLIDLQKLDLASNQITAIPESIAQLVKLSDLHLEYNPLPEEVFAALKSGLPSFFRYLQSTAIARVYPRTVKLVLLGEPKSGKTTLLEALKGNPKPCDDSRKETLGVDVVNIEKPHPGDHQPMYLSVWDFAGQHIEHATHQFFLTENAIYLILWNARQGAESGKRDLWYWLELLKMRVRDPRFLLVATHTEHTPPDLNLSAIKESYPGCEGNFPIELQTLTGVDSLETKILELAADSPSLRAAWPPVWLSVRDEVREVRKKQAYMTPAAFAALMKEKQVKGQVEQKDLAGQLHNLGEILYYQERDELSNLVILNPEWVTELIALVVRSKEVRDDHGILSNEDLEKLWESAKLQPGVQEHLVRLMDWFDLTYSTGHAKEMGIVVEALPFATPEELERISLPKDQPRTEMIFRFPSLQRRLPPGIPTWGIARAHRYSQCKPWRDAASFEDPDSKSRALILASETKKEVRLSVVADYPPFFFGVMQSVLLDTFRRYPGAQPERRVPCSCKPECQGTYLYEVVMERLRRGKAEITCPDSGEDVAIESLLSGARRPETKEGLHALRSEMRRLFTEQLRAQREQMEKTCPSVFTLTPSRGFQQLDSWLESFTKAEELDLMLYCEHDSGWHTNDYSVYRFTPDQEWFDKLKASWNRLAGVTKYVGPLAKAFGKVTATPHIEAVGLGIEKLPEAPRSPSGLLSRELSQKEKPGLVDIETRVLLEELIDYLDSQRPATSRNGGLHPYLIEDGRLLWLCPMHLKEHKKR